MLGPKPRIHKDATNSSVTTSNSSTKRGQSIDRLSLSDLSDKVSALSGDGSDRSFNRSMLMSDLERPSTIHLPYKSHPKSKSIASDTLSLCSESYYASLFPPEVPPWGGEPPPRHLLGPKPARFRNMSMDSEALASLAMEVKIINSKRIIASKKGKKSGDKLMDKKDRDDIAQKQEESVKKSDDQLVDNEVRDDVIQTDLEIIHAKHSVELEATDANRKDEHDPSNEAAASLADSRLDYSTSDSSTDTTVKTVIEVNKMAMLKNLAHKWCSTKSIDSSDSLIYDGISISQGASTSKDSTDILSLKALDPIYELCDECKRKEQFNNAKQSTHSLSKNLASEITEFLKTSASKLKPACMDQAKRDLGTSRVRIDRDTESEPILKPAQRLIPRSPYITSSPFYEQKISPRRSSTVKRPPFHAWNINSKNAAVCPHVRVSPSKHLSPTKSSPLRDLCVTKELKNIENVTRRIILLQAKHKAKDVPTKEVTTTEVEVYEAASTSGLPLKTNQRNASRKSLPGKANESKTPSPIIAELCSQCAKAAISPGGLLVPKASSRSATPETPDERTLEDMKFASESLPKIHICLPPPPVKVAKVKTQLPCQYYIPKWKIVSKSIARPRPRPWSAVFPEDVPEKKPQESPKFHKSKSLTPRKWASLMNLSWSRDDPDFQVDGFPTVCCKFGRYSTWPLRKVPPKNRYASPALSTFVCPQ